MPERPVALVFNGVWSHYAVATAPKYRDLVELVYVHDLARIDLDAFQGLLVPFQSDHQALAAERDRLYAFLARGRRIAVFGDSAHWLEAEWASRPLDNHWWKTDPGNPPVVDTDFTHPLFATLTPRQAGFHHHGVYLGMPPAAEVLQRSRAGEVVTWRTREYGGELLASTMDPIVEHGVHQIGHLDALVDRLLWWLGGAWPPAMAFSLDAEAYGRGFTRA